MKTELKTARKAIGLTQVEAAKLCGVSARQWSIWETGKAPSKKCTPAMALEILKSKALK